MTVIQSILVVQSAIAALLIVICINLKSDAATLSHVSQTAPKKHSIYRRDLGTVIVTNENGRLQRNVTSRVGISRAGKRSRFAIENLFREQTKNYPEDEIKTALQQTPEDVKSLYNVLNTALDPNMNLSERVAHYYGDENGGVKEETICSSVMRNIYPREATRRNSIVYVPNNQEFMQVIQAEICQSPDAECNYLQDSLPYGLTSVCYQKYAYKKLLYFDSLEKRMASDLFRYPSCCSCYIKISPLDLRSGINGTTTTSDTSIISEKFQSTPSPIVSKRNNSTLGVDV